MFDALLTTVAAVREVYLRMRDQAMSAELAARQAYRVLTRPSELQSEIVDPVRLNCARETARAAARAHSTAEEAARDLRAVHSVLASSSLAWASGNANAQFALLNRGAHALRVIEMMLLSEAQHRFMGAIFHGASTMSDPGQPLPPESLVLFDDSDELERAMIHASRPIPVLEPREGAIHEVAAGAGIVEQIRAAARAANDAGELQALGRRTTLSLDRVYRTAQLHMAQTNRSVLAPLREQLDERDEIFRLVQLETIGVADAALQDDVPLSLRQALTEFLLSAVSTAGLTAQTYVRDLEHLIRLAVAGPQGALTGVPSHLRGSELLGYVNMTGEEALNPSLAQNSALWSLTDIFLMVDEMASAWLSVQSIAAFRFKDLPDRSSDDR